MMGCRQTVLRNSRPAGCHRVCVRAECSRGRRRWPMTSRIEPTPRGKCAGAIELRARSARSLRRARMLRALRTASTLPRKKGRNRSRAMRQPAWVISSTSMGHDGGGQPAGGHVRPEDELRVAGHPALECGAGVIVGGRDLVEDPAARDEDAAIAGPAEPEAQVDVLVIGAVERVEAADLPDRLGAVKTSSSRWRRRPLRAGGRSKRRRAGRGLAWWASRPGCRNRRPSRRGRGRSGPGPAARPSRRSDRRTVRARPRSSPG